MRKRILLAVVAILGLFIAFQVTSAAATPKIHKSYVCKYVGTPGVDERLQTGQNPIWVDNSSLTGKDDSDVQVNDTFSDKHGKSVVIVANTDKLTPEPGIDQCPPPDDGDCDESYQESRYAAREYDDDCEPESTTTTVDEVTTTTAEVTTTTEEVTTTTIPDDEGTTTTASTTTIADTTTTIVDVDDPPTTTSVVQTTTTAVSDDSSTTTTTGVTTTTSDVTTTVPRPTPPPDLPITGSDTKLFVTLGILALILGAALLIGRRRGV